MGGGGDLTQGSVHFPAERGTDPGAAIFKIPGMSINRGLVQGDLPGSPLISLCLAQKGMATKTVLLFLGSEVLRVTLHLKASDILIEG